MPRIIAVGFSRSSGREYECVPTDVLRGGLVGRPKGHQRSPPERISFGPRLFAVLSSLSRNWDASLLMGIDGHMTVAMVGLRTGDNRRDRLVDHNAWSENISAFDELCWCTPQQLLPHYRAAASRARRLQAETTTRQVREHLLEMRTVGTTAGKIEGDPG